MTNSSPSDPASTSSTAPVRPRFGGILAVVALGVVLSTAALISYMQRLRGQIRQDTVQGIAPGLSLTREIIKTPTENTPILIVRIDTKKGWKLKLVPADETVLKRRAVSQIASTYNAANANRAPVAVNGGFFAYENGAPVGAVKLDGEWVRLPWKNRTAIGWDDGAKPLIDNLSARASVRFGGGEIPIANLNGGPGASGSAWMTWRGGSSYLLKPGEAAAIVSGGKVQSVASSGKISIGREVQVLVSGAASPQKPLVASMKAGDVADFVVEATPAKWNSTKTILGAGPRLLLDGNIKATQQAEEFKPDVLARGPRTIIGIGKEGELIVMVIESWFKPAGAEKALRGMTLDAAASEIQRAGAVQAINLDGGSSTTMWVRGKTVTASSDFVQGNQIIEKAAERREVGVANAILIEKSEPQR